VWPGLKTRAIDAVDVSVKTVRDFMDWKHELHAEHDTVRSPSGVRTFRRSPPAASSMERQTFVGGCSVKHGQAAAGVQ
jgi:hypothetical protein